MAFPALPLPAQTMHATTQPSRLLRNGLSVLLVALLLCCAGTPASAAHLPSSRSPGSASGSSSGFALARRAETTNTTSGNVTNAGVYTVTSSSPSSLSGIASQLNVSLCSLARLNRVADTEIPFVAGEGLLIPISKNSTSSSSEGDYTWPDYEYADDGDNSSCVVPRTNGTRTCVYGGAHTYTAQSGDTLEFVARKLNLTLDALLSTANAHGSSNASAELTAGSSLKVPQCAGSSCKVKPYRFTYGTYVDLAEEYGTTVGQLMGVNYGYNHSDVVDVGETPIITLYHDCKATEECEADPEKCEVVS